jgi:hypothetical protein
MPVVPNKAQYETPLDARFEASVSLATLPPPDTERWVARRKAQVVAAVQAGLLSLDDALARYKLSLEEYTAWQRGLYRHGLRGLQITHLQICKLADRRKNGRRPGKKAARWNGRHA